MRTAAAIVAAWLAFDLAVLAVLLVLYRRARRREKRWQHERLRTARHLPDGDGAVHFEPARGCVSHRP